MTKTTTNNTDTQSLIGQDLPAEYLYQEQTAELLAADAESAEFEGYQDYSIELENSAWEGAREVERVLIKRACEHTSCSHFQCSRSTRIGGIEI